MNMLLWIVQVALALFCLAGGQYKVFHFDALAQMPQTAALSHVSWGALGIFEMLCAILLIAPAAAKWLPVLTPLAAAALALESLGLALLFAQYSLALTSTNPLIYVVLLGVVAAFVAYGRFALRPIG